MSLFQLGHTSQEVYVNAQLLVKLHEAGVGPCEAILALEPIAATMWRLLRESQESEDYDYPSATLSTDPSVTVICETHGMDDRLEFMTIEIEREGRFCLVLCSHAEEEGERVRFEDMEPLVRFTATDANELATFLTLAKLNGGTLDVAPRPERLNRYND